VRERRIIHFTVQNHCKAEIWYPELRENQNHFRKWIGFFLPPVWHEFCWTFIALCFLSLPAKVNEQASLGRKKKSSLTKYD